MPFSPETGSSLRLPREWASAWERSSPAGVPGSQALLWAPEGQGEQTTQPLPTAWDTFQWRGSECEHGMKRSVSQRCADYQECEHTGKEGEGSIRLGGQERPPR